MSALAPGDLVLCAGTAPAAGFAERAAAAAAAGFRGLSLFITDYVRAREEGLSDADLSGILADHDLAVAEIDPLLSWVGGEAAGDPDGAAFFQHGEEDFFRAAEALGARSLNAVCYSERPLPTEALAGAFAGLCDRAAERGLLVCLEFLPWTQVANARGALEVVEQAGRPNGGIMLDTWHHFRSGDGPDDLLRIPGERILGVQLNDAPAAAEANPVEETLHRRLLPGAGDIDLAGILQALRDIDCRAPWGVEVFSDELAALPAGEAARRAAEAVRSLTPRDPS